MTLEGWGICILLAIFVIGAGAVLFVLCTGKWRGVWLTAGIVVAILIFVFGFWYYNNTASGIRARTDEQSELQLGLNRIVTIYTADGNVLKQYEGKIDIEQDQGYVKFDWNGKRYIYYNCYVETIAEIP